MSGHTPKPLHPHHMRGRLSRACELAEHDLRLARERYRKTEIAYKAGRNAKTTLDADAAAIHAAERLLEAATRYRDAFAKLYTSSGGFAPGYGPADVMPFQLAWPEPRSYVPGIPNPHVPPPKPLSTPPRTPRRVAAEKVKVTAVQDRSGAPPDPEPPTQVQPPEPYDDGPEEKRHIDVPKRAAEFEASLPPAREADEPVTVILPDGTRVPVGTSPPTDPPAAPAAKPVQKSPVGDKCPPEHGKFRKDDGRRRPGRPKGSKNMKTLVIKSVGKKAIVVENGRKSSMSRLEALVESAIIAGLGRNPKDRAYAIGLAEKYLPTEEPEAAAPLSEEDKAILRSQIDLLAMLGEDADDDDDDKGGGET